MYKDSLDKLLSEINIFKCLFGCDQNCEVSEHAMAIDQYYMALIHCINQVTEVCVPWANSQGRNFNIPGWSNLVKNKHDIARKAFLDWVTVGRPRAGPFHVQLSAHFKLALHQCRAYEQL